MALQYPQDVVKEVQSGDAPSSTDASVEPTTTYTSGGERGTLDHVDEGTSNENSSQKYSKAAKFHPEASDSVNSQYLRDGSISETASNFEVPFVNGFHNDHPSSEDASYQNALVEGSDTDGSKADGSDQGRLLTRHDRSNSIKKPMSFKAVSVTKNFLAKSAATPSKSTGEKAITNGPPTPSLMASARPRLVAKTGKDARSMTSNTRAAGTSGPDASKVWNRNRPTPAPPQKQFTDEELKQQYGIHLATRLQADEAGKESKWADIDDEEDDWAPETVNWMDGTKSTILPSDHQTKPVQDIRAPLPLKPDASDNEKPLRQIEPKASPALGVGKTILRPGVRGTAPQTKPGLVLKGLPEKPSDPVKPPSSGPSRSPWASLPPVDKASPITFNPPPSNQVSSMPPGPESQDTDSTAEVLIASPAREIAADDFDRSWRETEKGARELFDSRSGRYEPVKNTMRRSSLRQDGGFRPPSLLQRPSQQSQSSQVEPTNTFQARKSSSNESQPWSRKRSPSTADEKVLGERRISRDATASPMQTRTAVTSSSYLPKTTQNSTSPIQSTTKPAAADHASPALQPYSARVPDGRTEQGAGYQPSLSADPRLEQQKLMRERIERNRQRKLEEEAREEAAKQERIRQKLEALKATASEQGQSGKMEDTSAKEQGHNAQTKDGDLSRATDRLLQAGSTTELIKDSPVHFSNQLSEKVGRPSSTSNVSQQYNASHRITNQVQEQAPHQPHPSTTLEPQIDGRTALEAARPSSTAGQWNGVTSNSHSATNWASPGRNVWGPSIHERTTLGNGSFESGLQGLPSMNPSSHHPNQRPSSGLPGPIVAPSLSPRAASPHVQGIAHPDMQAVRRAWQDPPSRLTRDEHMPSRPFSGLDARDQDQSRPLYRETFMQGVSSGGLDASQLHVPSQTSTAGSDSLTSESRHLASNGKIGQTYTPQPPASGSINSKASRFFGVPVDRSSQGPTIRPSNHQAMMRRSPSPPPPDSWGHPVFGSSQTHPLVHLPMPSPTVRLPPAALSPTSEIDSVVMPSRHQPPRSGAQPIVSQLAWQDRFNGLFGRKQTPHVANPPLPTSPQALSRPLVNNGSISKVQPVDVSSSSRNLLDIHYSDAPATVSLPLPRKPISHNGTNFMVSSFLAYTKPTEDCLLDEREFGSSPTVSIPKVRYNSVVVPNYARPKHAPRNIQIEANVLWTGSLPPSQAIFEEASTVSTVRVFMRRLGKASVEKSFLLKRPASVNKVSKGPKKFERKRRDGPTPPTTSHLQHPPSSTPNLGSERRTSNKWAKPPKGRNTGVARR